MPRRIGHSRLPDAADGPVITLQTYTYTVKPVRNGWSGGVSAGPAISRRILIPPLGIW